MTLGVPIEDRYAPQPGDMLALLTTYYRSPGFSRPIPREVDPPPCTRLDSCEVDPPAKSRPLGLGIPKYTLGFKGMARCAKSIRNVTLSTKTEAIEQRIEVKRSGNP